LSVWGNREHKTEKNVIFLLLLDVTIAAAFVKFRDIWIAYVLSGAVAITFLVDLYARFSHFMEEWHFDHLKPGSWTPRGRKK
jgi:hypothetical protein